MPELLAQSRPRNINAHTLEALDKGYISKYDDIFQEQERNRRDTFNADLKLYDTGFDRIEQDIKGTITSRPTLFQKVSQALQAIYAGDQQRHDRVTAEKMSCHSSKNAHRQSLFSVSLDTFVIGFNHDHVYVVRKFALVDDGEWNHITMLQQDVQSLFQEFENSLHALTSKHANIFEVAMQKYRALLDFHDSDPYESSDDELNFDGTDESDDDEPDFDGSDVAVSANC